MTVEVMTMRKRCKDDNVGCRPQSARVDKDQGAMLLLWGENQGFEFHSFPGAELLQYIRADFKGGAMEMVNAMISERIKFLILSFLVLICKKICRVKTNPPPPAYT